VPSPIGHALAGVIAGQACAAAPPTLRSAFLFGAIALAPDLDLLVGAHSGPTHGLGVALLAGAIAFAVGARSPGLGNRKFVFRFALAVTAAYASHTLLDWLGSDTSPPIGIMALWPFSREYYESSLHLFMAISRRYWLPEFWTHNVLAVARELVILVPVLALLVRLRSRA
jgi:inner membrane protein